VPLVPAWLVGGAVGLAREATGQMAGLRTHMSVALGAALFAVVSAYSFAEFIGPRADSNYQVDVTRVASNVVTGVGFLGGGAIIKLGASIRGLTTAASMWVTAAIGLAIGLGNYSAGFASGAALVFALTVLRGRRRWVRRFSRRRETVTLEVAVDGDVSRVLAVLNGLDPKSLSAQRGSAGWTVQADVRRSDVEAVLSQLADRPGVTGMAAVS
jgi:putative Mg2+ transporter-C (MgtC) family protein